MLTLICHDPTLSRASIARQTTLSPASVSGIVDHLIREGFVREEAAAATGAVGRRPVRLVFNPAARVTLGIAIDVRDVTAGLDDLGGEMRATQHAVVAPEAGPAAIVDAVTQVARRALRGVASRDVLGVGVAVPGLVRWPDGAILFSPNLGWRDVPIRAMLEERLGRPVLVDNEVRALALAEHSYGAARGARTVVVIDAAYGRVCEKSAGTGEQRSERPRSQDFSQTLPRTASGGPLSSTARCTAASTGLREKSATTSSSPTAPCAAAATGGAWRR